MSAIDLLFAAKPQSERIHQAVLAALLREPRFIEKLLGLHFTAPEIAWEPDGTLFDLAIVDGEQRTSIELKLDASLGRGQISRQSAHSSEHSHRLVYLLVGTSGISRGPHWPVWEDHYPPGLESDRKPILRSAAELREALRHCTHLTPSPPEDWRALASDYERVLERIEARTRGYLEREPSQFTDLDYLGYFDALRQSVGVTRARIQQVSRKSDPFIAFAWRIQELPTGALFLQFEATRGQKDAARLVLKFASPDRKAALKARKFIDDAAASTNLDPAFESLRFVPSTRKKSGKTMTIGAFQLGQLPRDPADPKFREQIETAVSFAQTVAQKLK